MEYLQFGRVAALTARHGEVLQVRPTAASSRELTEAVSQDGGRFMTNPRGFYLRPAFTANVLAGVA